MTQLPSVAKLNDFKRRVTPRKVSIKSDPDLCGAHDQPSSTCQLNLER
jgi:hypothetical protein